VADRLVGHHALSFSIYFYLYIGGDGVSLVIYMNIHADFCDAKSHQLLPCQRSGPLTRVSIIHMFNNCYYSVDQHHTQRQTDRLKKLRIQKMGNLFCPLFVVRAKPAARDMLDKYWVCALSSDNHSEEEDIPSPADYAAMPSHQFNETYNEVFLRN
jgi:hypothetical protein